MQPNRNFFSLLFDLSFTEFVTPKIVSVIYLLAIIGAGIGALTALAGAAAAGAGGFFLGLILAVLWFFGGIIGARLVLEAVVALFTIANNTSTIARSSGAPAREERVSGTGAHEG